MCIYKIGLIVIVTSEPLVDSRKTLEKVVKHIDAVLPLIELDMPCCTHFTANRYATIPTTSSNTSPSTY